jgi:hypothetical protein
MARCAQLSLVCCSVCFHFHPSMQLTHSMFDVPFRSLALRSALLLAVLAFELLDAVATLHTVVAQVTAPLVMRCSLGLDEFQC